MICGDCAVKDTGGLENVIVNVNVDCEEQRWYQDVQVPCRILDGMFYKKGEVVMNNGKNKRNDVCFQ